MTTTDPEYDRLRDAVVDAAMSSTSGRAAKGNSRVDMACHALRDYRTKSSNPPPRVEPPEGNVGGRDQHWLVGHIQDDALVATWVQSGTWMFPDGKILTPEAVYGNGWRYHSPALPDTRIEPTDDAIFDWLKARHLEGNYYVQVLRDALAHFSPTQPAPVQQEITDAEIIGLGVSYHFIERNLGPYTVENFRFIECCRDLLAKYSPTLSNKTLDTLYDLAKTEEREQFKLDAKMVVGRKGWQS